MARATGCAILPPRYRWDLGPHIMAGGHKSELLPVLGPTPGVGLAQVQEFPEECTDSSHGWGGT